MKILVTGGTGFIGSHLIKLLRSKKHDVYALSIDKNVPEKNLILADITDRKRMLEIIPRFDMVYHLAGQLGTSELITKAYDASSVNILGTVNILDAALSRKTKVLYVTKPNCWLNTYSITKLAGESFTKMYFDQFKLPTMSVRWYNVYGPNQSFHCQKAVPFFIRWALKNQNIEVWGDGEQTMDLIHATDAVMATMIVGESKKLFGTTVDIGSGVEVTVNMLAKMIISQSKSNSKILHLPMRDGETPNTRLKADTRVINSLGFRSHISLEEGIQETIDWYRNNLK